MNYNSNNPVTILKKDSNQYGVTQQPKPQQVKVKTGDSAPTGALTLSSLKLHNEWAVANGILANPITLLQQGEAGYSYKALVEKSVMAVDSSNKEKPPSSSSKMNYNSKKSINNQVTILKKDSKQCDVTQQPKPKPQQVKILTRNSDSFTKSMHSTVSNTSLAGLSSTDNLNSLLAKNNDNNNDITASFCESNSATQNDNHTAYTNDIVDDIYNTLNFDDADDDESFIRNHSHSHIDTLTSTINHNDTINSNLNSNSNSNNNYLNDLSVFQGITLRVDAPEFTPSFLMPPPVPDGQRKGRRGGRRVRRGDKARQQIVIDFDKLQTPVSK